MATLYWVNVSDKTELKSVVELSKKMPEILKYEKVEREVKTAYADCWKGDSYLTDKIRQLEFLASEVVTRQEAYEIMSVACKSYNCFYPGLILQLPEDSKVRIAREGSVCLYVETAEELGEDFQEEVSCDELTKQNNVYRIWWD